MYDQPQCLHRLLLFIADRGTLSSASDEDGRIIERLNTNHQPPDLPTNPKRTNDFIMFNRHRDIRGVLFSPVLISSLEGPFTAADPIGPFWGSTDL